VYLYSANVTFDHCILWANCADTQHDVVSMGGTGSGVVFQCCDASPAGVGGTGTVFFDVDCFEANPRFCGAEPCVLAPTAAGDYALDATSPAAPPNSAACGLVGALDVGCTLTSVGPAAVGSELSSRAVPNPATGRTRILFSAPAGPVRATIFDAGGRVVRRWVERHGGDAGSVEWNGRDRTGRAVPSGVYFYRLETAGSTSSGRVVRLTR
jgi:hypothetical protein